MSTKAARKAIMEAQRAGTVIKTADSEQFPEIYARKIVRKEIEIDSYETSALKVEIADLKSERDRYKKICFSGGGNALINNLQIQNQIHKDKILELKEVIEVKKVKIDKLKEENSRINEIIREIYRNGYDEDMVLKLENMRETIIKMSKINMELRFEINELKNKALDKAVDGWIGEVKSENK